MSNAADDELFYEKKQSRNAVTRFFHSFRHATTTAFVEKHFQGPFSALDIGCGPGRTYALLQRFPVTYHGVDIREDFIATASRRYDDVNCRFELQNVADPAFDFSGYDLIVALETFEHIPEGDLVRIIERIAEARPRYLLCSVPVEIGPSVAIKNFGSALMGYNRGSGDFWQTLRAATYNLNRIPPHGTGHLGFNWIWLEQTLRHNLEIVESRSLPYRWLPKWLAPTVMFVCRPYEQRSEPSTVSP